MKEIGGYIEFEHYIGTLLHENAIALNCGRNALACLLEAKKIKRLALPYFICDSVIHTCKKYSVQIDFYSISEDLLPEDPEIIGDEWLYLVNYYGQTGNNTIEKIRNKYKRIIVDNAQAYFQMPVSNTDTFYSCRKFFGVPDGAFLYTDAESYRELPEDESRKRMDFLLGRFERPAAEFYEGYVSNNKIFEQEPVKRMSRLTDNLLRGIDYDSVRKKRTDNFSYLHGELEPVNKLKLNVPEGAFMYPFWTDNGAEKRKKLQAYKIYIPVLWPSVLKDMPENSLEYELANNILPLPVDQRYDEEDMKYIIKKIAENS